MTERRGLNRRQLIATFVAVVISAIFIVTLIAPQPGITTTTPIDTLSLDDLNSFVAEPATEGIENPRPYVHPTGFFQSYQPAGPAWQLMTNETSFSVVNERQVVEARFRGNNSCGIVHFITETDSPYEDINALNQSLNTDYFNTAWSAYGSWELASRDLEESRIVIEFNLRQPADFGNLCPESYRARSITWQANGIIHHVRMVVRAEDIESLERLEALLVPTLVTYPNNIPTIDNAWRVQTSFDQTHFTVLPPTWIRDQGSTTTRTVYTDNLQHQLSIETFEDTPLADDSEAEAWVIDNTPSNAEILSARAVRQPYAAGYQFSYRFTNSEGVVTSGIITLLNDADSVLYVGDMRVAGVDTDILTDNDIEGTLPEASLREVASGITVMAPLS